MKNLKKITVAFMLVAGLVVTMSSCSKDAYYEDPIPTNPIEAIPEQPLPPVPSNPIEVSPEQPPIVNPER